MARITKKQLWIIGGATTVAIAAGAVFLAAGVINNAGRFEQNIAGDCAPLVAIAFRGSGEANLAPQARSNAGQPYRYGTSELVTNGWEGATLRGLFSELSTTTYTEDFRADSIPVVPVGPAGENEPFGYDAIEAVTEASSVDSALTFSKSRLLVSAARGAEAASHVIQSYLKKSEGCPVLPKFVIVGYSQGAMAARHTAELNPESVLGIVNIGDPYQKPKGTGVRAGGLDGTGLIRWKADDQQKTQLDGYYGIKEFKSSICHSGDPICEFSPISGLWKLATGTYGDHLDYYTDKYPDEATTDAQVIAKLGYEQWLLARAAAEAGESVSRDEATAASARPAALRAVSLMYAGTPTLFSALSPWASLLTLGYDFDLDGDGTFETPSTTGTAWATFDTDGAHTVGVRVTNLDTGESSQSQLEVNVAPEREGVLDFGTGDSAVTVSAPATVVRGQRMMVSVSGAAPLEAALFAAGAGVGGSAPIPLATSPDGWTAGILVPASVPIGSYRLVIGGAGDAWASAPLSVVDEAPPAATPPPAPKPKVTPVAVVPPAPAPPVIVPPVVVPPVVTPSRAIVLTGLPLVAGEPFTVTGTNFTPNSTVTLSAPGTGFDATTITTDAVGSFSLPTMLPPTAAPGDYAFLVTDNGTSTEYDFTVHQAFAVDIGNPHVQLGDYLDVSGSGLIANSAVTATIQGTALSVTSTADAGGLLSITFPIPLSMTPGNYVLVVSGNGIDMKLDFWVGSPAT